MYLYSSDSNSIKVILSKTDAELFIINQPSHIIRSRIILAIFNAALPNSKFTLSTGKISAKLLEFSKEEFILEFTQRKPINTKIKKTLYYCYKCSSLNEVSNQLGNLIKDNAKVSKLYCKDKNYFILSEKQTNDKIYIVSEHIDGVLQEYANLISENATEEIAGLL